MASKESTQRRAARVRRQIKKVAGDRPRLSVYRSSKHIYAQVIDDAKGHTLAAASTIEKDLKGSLKTGSDVAAAAAIGKLVAERASKAGIKDVVFDRGPYIYHGRVKALAEAAREVPEAIRKATESAKRGMIFVPLRSGRTLHHDVEGRWGAGKVLLRAAKQGTGIIAGGPMRAVFETLGMHDVVAKSMGSSNPYNMVRATFDALKSQLHPKDVAAQRGIKYSALQARRGSAVAAEE